MSTRLSKKEKEQVPLIEDDLNKVKEAFKVDTNEEVFIILINEFFSLSKENETLRNELQKLKQTNKKMKNVSLDYGNVLMYGEKLRESLNCILDK